MKWDNDYAMPPGWEDAFGKFENMPEDKLGKKKEEAEKELENPETLRSYIEIFDDYCKQDDLIDERRQLVKENVEKIKPHLIEAIAKYDLTPERARKMQAAFSRKLFSHGSFSEEELKMVDDFSKVVGCVLNMKTERAKTYVSNIIVLHTRYLDLAYGDVDPYSSLGGHVGTNDAYEEDRAYEEYMSARLPIDQVLALDPPDKQAGV